ncbi:MAG: hypothetical protein GX605_05055, partial [Chloroflexi bacterium]|nr:hypothetical protein [Chloroflexota bacterium]
CRRRGVRRIKATVDQSYQVMTPYMARAGYHTEGSFLLYGRPMWIYARDLDNGSDGSGRSEN